MKKSGRAEKSGKNAKIPILDRVYNVLLISLAPILFFSYYPNISLGSNQTMNFELSLPLLWLVVFDLLSLVLFFQSKPKLRFSKIWPWLLFPGFLTISAFWSLNPLRGFLTVGILWLLFFAIFSFFVLRKTVQFLPNFGRFFWRVFFGASLLISAWCWLQCILDLTGLSQSATLMCDGCVYQMFGFPHPNGFAIEPQFMGNLLLAPTLMAAWFAFTTNNSRKKTDSPTKSRVVCWLVFFALAATLFLTFSRGAIYAFLIGLAALTIWRIAQVRSARPLVSWVVTGVAFLFTLNAQGLMAQLGPTSDTYPIAVSKVVHQLSLGLIDFRPAETTSETEQIGGAEQNSESGQSGEMKQTSESAQTPESGQSSEIYSKQNAETADNPDATDLSDDSEEPAFTGYVAESTNTRLRLTDSALKIWSSSPGIIVFGVGLGGAGQALFDNNLSPAPKEIVQNQYASLLLETGILGCILAAFTLYLVFRRFNLSSFRVSLFALILAYAVTLCFFSGLANALQIYLMPPLILLVVKIQESSK